MKTRIIGVLVVVMLVFFSGPGSKIGFSRLLVFLLQGSRWGAAEELCR